MTIQLYARSKARPAAAAFSVSSDEKFWLEGIVPGVRSWIATTAERYRYTAGAPVTVNILLSGQQITKALARYPDGKFEMNGAFQIRKYSDGRIVMWYFPSKASNTNRVNVYNGLVTSFAFSATTGPADSSAGNQISNDVTVSITEEKPPPIAGPSGVVASPEYLALLRSMYPKAAARTTYGLPSRGITTVGRALTGEVPIGPTYTIPVSSEGMPSSALAEEPPTIPAEEFPITPPITPVTTATMEAIGLIILVALVIAILAV